MPTYTGTSGNDAWTVVNPGTFTLDGLGGVDTLYMGTSLRSSFTITRSADGAVHVDSVSGASAAFHATLLNMERLVFASGRDTVDLATYFGDITPPTVSSTTPASQATGVAASANLVVTFSEAVQRGVGTVVIRNAAGAVVSSFDAATSPALTISGKTLTIDPPHDLPWAARLTVELSAGSFKDLSGNPLAATTALSFTTGADPGPAVLTGTAGDDTFSVGAGTHAIDGLGGIDTVVLGRPRADFVLTQDALSTLLSSKDAGTVDTLTHVERLQFSDGGLALDLDGHAGEVARLIAAVFGPGAVANPAYVGIGLKLADQGMSEPALAELAIGATGRTSHDDIVTLLWTHVVGGAPTAEDKAPFVAMLDQGMSVGELVTMAAETALNVSHVDLVGLAHSGLPFG